MANVYAGKPWPIRMWRWLLHKPRYTVLAYWWFARYKNPSDLELFPTRRKWRDHLWTCAMSLADIEMENTTCIFNIQEQLAQVDLEDPYGDKNV